MNTGIESKVETVQKIKKSFIRSCVEGYEDAKILGKKVANFHMLVNHSQLDEWIVSILPHLSTPSQEVDARKLFDENYKVFKDSYGASHKVMSREKFKEVFDKYKRLPDAGMEIEGEWIHVDRRLPDGDVIVEILFENHTKDISRVVNGKFYIWDSEVMPITHWRKRVEKTNT